MLFSVNVESRAYVLRFLVGLESEGSYYSSSSNSRVPSNTLIGTTLSRYTDTDLILLDENGPSLSGQSGTYLVDGSQTRTWAKGVCTAKSTCSFHRMSVHNGGINVSRRWAQKEAHGGSTSQAQAVPLE